LIHGFGLVSRVLEIIEVAPKLIYAGVGGSIHRGAAALRSGVILAGGKSSRMGVDKGLISLAGKPIVAHVVKRLTSIVDEVIVVVCSDSQSEAYRGIGAHVVVDVFRSDTPLIGAHTGLAEARGEYAMLVAGDQPLVDPRVVELLFAEAEGHDAATPYWPNGWVEPLHSVYKAKPSAQLALNLERSGKKRLRLLLDSLPDVKRVPIDEVRRIDPELRTLIDIDTPEELDRVRRLIEKP
jgi:molybdenum cofactor guanylyltransferase